jgi:hypothetical protein
VRRLILPLLALAGLGHTPALLAQACSSAASGSWTVAATWNAPCNVAGGPTAANAVTINNGHVITTPAAAVAAGSLDIAAGIAATSLTLGGNLTVTNASGGTGNIRIFGSSANVTRTLSVNSRTLAVTGSVTVNGGTAGGGATNISQLSVTTGIVTIGGALNIAAGTIDTHVARVTLTSGRITVTGVTTVTGGATALRDALLTIAGASVAGNGYILNGGLTIASTIATSAAVTMTGAAGGRITVVGNVDNRDTLSIAAGIFSATSSAGTFTTSNTSAVAGSKVSSTTVTTGSLTIAGNTFVTGGVVNPSRATMSVTSTGTITIGTIATPRSLTVTPGTINSSIATVSVTGAGRIDVPGATGNVTLTGSNAAGVNRNSVLTVSGIAGVGQGINIGGDLTVGTVGAVVATTATVQTTGVAAGANASRITVAGNVINNNTIAIGSGVFTANGATFSTSNASAVAGSHITSTSVTSGTLAIAGNATVAGGVVNPSGATMSVTTGVITVGGNLGITAGNILNSNATVSVTTGRISVTGNATVTGGTAAGRNALLQVGGAPAVAGNGLNVNGTLSTVLNLGPVTTAAISITVATGVVNANGNFTNNGTFTNGAVAGQLFLGGATSTINGSFVRGTGTVTMDGSAAQALSGTAIQTISGTSGFHNFTINNAAGVTIGNNVSVNNTTTFTSGNVATGASTLIAIGNAGIGNCITPSVVRTSGHVVGRLQKVVPGGASSCTYEVGVGSSYTPAIISFPVTTSAGTLIVGTTAGDHGSIGASQLDAAKSVNLYWSVTNNTVGGIGTGWQLNFNFVTPNDYDAAGDPAKFTVQRFSAGWFNTSVNSTCTPIDGAHLCNQINGQTAFGDFAIGEANYTAGNAGWFNVFESSTGAGAHLGNIFTKIVGTGFSLDVVAVNAFRNGVKPNYSTNPITVELLNTSDNSGALNAETDCRASWTLVPGQSFSLSPVWALSRATVAIPAQANALREGRIRVTQGTLVACSTDNFSIRPTGFTVGSSNATNNGTSGAPTFRAGGDNFNLTATAVAGYDGTPSVDNTAGMVIGTPNQGTVGGSFSAAPVGTGIASGSTFTYSEVGNVGLAANAVFDSGFTSVDTPGADCNVGFSNVLVGGRYGCSIGSAAVAQTTGASGFGRFIPHNFNVTTNSPTFATGCGTFTYVGAPFSYGTAPVMTVTARNAGNAATANYSSVTAGGAYMKLTNASLTPGTQPARYARFDALGGGLTPALDTGALPATAGDPAIGSFVNGVGTLTFSSGGGLGFTRSTTTPNAPFNADIALSLNVIDTDSVAFAANPAAFGAATAGNGIAFSGGKDMRFGRLRLLNASGSANLDLTIPLETQYWTGAGFQTNTLDGCTSLSAVNLAFSAYSGGINAGNMNAANISLGGAFAAGIGSLKLTKPTPAPASPGSTTLTVDLAAETKTYLQGNWGTPNYTANPASRAAFGTFGAQPRQFIFFREIY